MEAWEPKGFEEKLLYKYWSQSKGNLFLEVPIGNKNLGNWPPKSKIRRIDGVLVIDEKKDDPCIAYLPRNYSNNLFFEQVQGRTVELIEVKKSLNRTVIGQVIVGMDMFERQYQTNNIVPVILCQIGDPALEWVCKKRNIVVEIMRDSDLDS